MNAIELNQLNQTNLQDLLLSGSCIDHFFATTFDGYSIVLKVIKSINGSSVFMVLTGPRGLNNLDSFYSPLGYTDNVNEAFSYIHNASIYTLIEVCKSAQPKQFTHTSVY